VITFTLHCQIDQTIHSN